MVKVPVASNRSSRVIKVINVVVNKLSPLFGFAAAIILMYILKKSIKNKAIFKEPKKVGLQIT